jgi:hypothetical protein
MRRNTIGSKSNAKSSSKRRRATGQWLSAALVGFALFALPPAAAYAIGATSQETGGPVHSMTSDMPARHAALVDMPVPALTPGLPPPELSALSDRRIVAGLILVLFAGLSALTMSMWRDLGRKVRS